MPFESKLTGFKSLTYQLRFVSNIYVFIYLRRVVCVCYLVFLIIAFFFFFFFGWGAFLVKQSLGYSNSSIVLCSPVSTI